MRWKAIATYRTAHGPLDVQYDLQELCDLHDFIELGPSFQALESIVITYEALEETLTIEQAKER